MSLTQFFLLIVALAGVSLWLARRAGVLEERSRHDRNRRALAQEQRDLAARPHRKPSALLRRMRRGDF